MLSVSGRVKDAQDANTRPVTRGGLAKFAAGFLLTMLAVLMLGSASAAEGARRRLRRTVGHGERRGLMRVRISEHSLVTGAIMVVAALGMILAGCGSSSTQTGSQATTTATAPTEPSVSLRLNVGSYTTSESTADLSAKVTPGAKVTATQTYPDNQGGKATLPLHFVRFPSGDWRVIVPLVLETFGSALRKTNKGENVVTVKATKVGYTPAEQTITITRQETAAERAAEQKKQTQRLKEEEANPNSEFNKNEREAEAKVKGAERQTEQEVKPYKEAEERSKNLEAKQAEERLAEEETREKRRLESEGK
jgi:hypothetical protein